MGQAWSFFKIVFTIRGVSCFMNKLDKNISETVGDESNKQTKNSSFPGCRIIVSYIQHVSNVRVLNLHYLPSCGFISLLSVQVFPVISLYYKIQGKLCYIRIIYHRYFLEKKIRSCII